MQIYGYLKIIAKMTPFAILIGYKKFELKTIQF